MVVMHGGDIYRNHVELDFSVNVNPLGMPESVKKAVYDATGLCGRYPDIRAEKLKRAVGAMQSVPEEYLVFGNGASELFLAVVHGIKPKKIWIPVPSFYGYEHAAEASGGEIIFYETGPENGFQVTEEFFASLTGEGLIFLANPGNPSGSLLDRAYVGRLLEYCKGRGIYVVLDECFIEFCGREPSMLPEVGRFDNLILVRAFTKSFSIPGIRLGYLVSSNAAVTDSIRRQLPEWNLSCFAQEAGCACALETGFLGRTKAYVESERLFLEEKLLEIGIRVFPSAANFLLFFSEKPFYEALLKRGILIRDCRDFRGLSQGYYRIAVKRREENSILLDKIGEIQCEKDGISAPGRN